MENSLSIVECIGHMVGGGGRYLRTDLYVTNYLYNMTSAIDSYCFPIL